MSGGCKDLLRPTPIIVFFSFALIVHWVPVFILLDFFFNLSFKQAVRGFTYTRIRRLLQPWALHPLYVGLKWSEMVVIASTLT